MYFDSHAHLNAPEYNKDIDEVIERARQVGVERIITIGSGYGVARVEDAAIMAGKRKNIWATVGVHPHEAKEDTPELGEKIRRIAAASKVVAIGEIGLDFHYDNSPRQVQRAVFEKYLALAGELDMPVTVHSREAMGETIAMLRNADLARKGVIHCFTGEAAEAEMLIGLGYTISIPGVVTFPKATGMHRAVEAIDLKNMIVETDCPFLSPVPKRGKRNEPSYLPFTIAKVAELKGVEAEEAGAIFTQNTRRIFGIE